jgi:hypothetical protein
VCIVFLTGSRWQSFIPYMGEVGQDGFEGISVILFWVAFLFRMSIPYPGIILYRSWLFLLEDDHWYQVFVVEERGHVLKGMGFLISLFRYRCLLWILFPDRYINNLLFPWFRRLLGVFLYRSWFRSRLLLRALSKWTFLDYMGWQRWRIRGRRFI